MCERCRVRVAGQRRVLFRASIDGLTGLPSKRLDERMFSELAFFSFVQLTDPSFHRAYNEWHQLDHRPENLALDGVAWGDRWRNLDEYADVTEGEREFTDANYVAMYWFRPPVDQAVAEWDALGEASFQWGRGPLIPAVKRPLLAFFKPVKGYTAPRALVSPEVLPYRPNQGLHVTVIRNDEPHSGEVHAAYTREDRELIPALLELDGVAGVWTFSYSHPQRHTSLPFDASPDQPQGSLRIRLVYLEEDPAIVTPKIRDIERSLDILAPGQSVVFSGPVKTIVPWQDWD